MDAGTYTGTFAWNNGLQELELYPSTQSEHSARRVTDGKFLSEASLVVQKRLTAANISSGQGTVKLSVMGSSPYLISIEEIEVTQPNLSEMLGYVASQNADKIKDFVGRYENINQQDLVNGRTALFYAAAGSRTTAVETLLGLGADPNIPDCDGDTPLVAAIAANSLQSMDEILRSKGNPNQANKIGITPLIRAVELNRSLPTVTSLIRFGADLKYVAPNGESALGLAEKNKNKSIVDAIQSATFRK